MLLLLDATIFISGFLVWLGLVLVWGFFGGEVGFFVCLFVCFWVLPKQFWWPEPNGTSLEGDYGVTESWGRANTQGQTSRTRQTGNLPSVAHVIRLRDSLFRFQTPRRANLVCLPGLGVNSPTSQLCPEKWESWTPDMATGPQPGYQLFLEKGGMPDGQADPPGVSQQYIFWGREEENRSALSPQEAPI